MTNQESRLPSTGAAELIQARIALLHTSGLGRAAVLRWEAAGMPLPPPELQVIAEPVPQLDGYMRDKQDNKL